MTSTCPGAFGVVANVSGNSVSLAVTTPTQLVTLTDANGSATTFTPSTPDGAGHRRRQHRVPRCRAGPDLAPRPLGVRSFAAGRWRWPRGQHRSRSRRTSTRRTGSARSRPSWAAAPSSPRPERPPLDRHGPECRPRRRSQHGDRAGHRHRAHPRHHDGDPCGQPERPQGQPRRRHLRVDGQADQGHGHVEDLQDQALARPARAARRRRRSRPRRPRSTGTASCSPSTAPPRPARSRSPSTASRRRSISTARPASRSSKTWTFKGALKTHTVVVTVLGTKATASKGTAVLPRRPEGEGLMSHPHRPRPTDHETGTSMTRRTLARRPGRRRRPRLSPCSAPRPTRTPTRPTPGQPIPGKTDSQLYAAVGADAFAELTNNLVTHYNAQAAGTGPTCWSRTTPSTRSPARPASTITTKPGCSVRSARTAPTPASRRSRSTRRAARPTATARSFCIDWVRSSRAKGTAAGEANLTFYAQSRDAVSATRRSATPTRRPRR